MKYDFFRIGLANDRALRSVFDIEILQRTTNYGQKQELNALDESRLEVDEENTSIVPTETILGVNMPVENLQEAGLSNETTAKSDKKLQRDGEEIKGSAENLLEAVDDEDDYIFNLAARKITRADYTNLTTRICIELNNNNNAEEDNPLHEFLYEMDISKEVEDLDNLGEKYREAVSAAAKMQIGFWFFIFQFIFIRLCLSR